MASAKFKLSVTGDKELQRKLSRLSADARKRIIEPALLRAGEILRDQAKENAPRRTGKLAESIRAFVAEGRNANKPIVRVETRAGFFQGKTFYGAFQEFGWRVGRRIRRRGADAKLRNSLRKKIPGKHYIKRALLTHGAQAQEAAIEEIRAGIEREAKRGGG